MSDERFGQLDLTVVEHSLSAVNDALEPYYKDVRESVLGHTALDAIADFEQRRESIREDVRMLKAFGVLLPPQEVRGEVDSQDAYKANVIRTATPDLYQAKVVQAYGLCYRSPIDHRSTIAYVVGERPDGPNDTQLLMVAPSMHATYSHDPYYGKKRPEVFDFAPKVLTVTVPAKAFAAYRGYIDRVFARSFTDRQVWSMKVEGEQKYVLAQTDLTPLRRRGGLSGTIEAIERHGLVPSLPQGWLERILRLASAEPVFSQPREVTFDDFDNGLNGWSVDKWMMNLAIAFGKQDEYRRLIEGRIVAAANPSQDSSV